SAGRMSRVSEFASAATTFGSARPDFVAKRQSKTGRIDDMTSTNQELWLRVKGRLRAEVGEDIYSSWFARMDLEGIEEETVRMSVPTRFLRSWIQSHYAERGLACGQAEQEKVGRIELMVRSSVLRPLPVKPAEQAVREIREVKFN